MRILFVSETYYPHINGIYYFVCRVGPLLQDKGHQVAVLVPSDSTSSYERRIDNIDVYGLPSLPVLVYPTIRIPFPLVSKSRILKIIKSFKPDIIHIQDHYLISQSVIKLNKDLKIPLIATNHFMPENFTALVKGESWKRRIENYLWKVFSKVFNQADMVTTPTETGVNIIQPRLRDEVKAIAISSGIDLESFNPFGEAQYLRKMYSIPDKPVLLYVGRLDPEKHIEEILNAVVLALKSVDFCFVAVGKGSIKKQLEQLAVELGISANVIFTGFVPDEDLPYFYKLSRCFIIASTAELLSLVTLQAMASGLPVIAVKAGALVELVQNEENGYLYERGDINSIVKAINILFSNDTLYSKMSQRSLELVQKHDIHKVVDSFEKLYQNCIA